jgi:hypothetical protein
MADSQDEWQKRGITRPNRHGIETSRASTGGVKVEKVVPGYPIA